MDERLLVKVGGNEGVLIAALGFVPLGHGARTKGPFKEMRGPSHQERNGGPQDDAGWSLTLHLCILHAATAVPNPNVRHTLTLEGFACSAVGLGAMEAWQRQCAGDCGHCAQLIDHHVADCLEACGTHAQKDVPF